MIFKTLWQAIDSLAEAIGHLSQTVFAISGELRQRAGIEGTPALPVIDQPPLPAPSGNGHAEEPVKARARK